MIERFFGTLKYEHLFRGVIADGDALDMEVHRFRVIYNDLVPPRWCPRIPAIQIQVGDLGTFHSLQSPRWKRDVIGGATDDRELVGVGRAIQPVAESSVFSGVPGTGRLVGDDEPQCLDHDVTSFLGLGRARTGLVGYAAG
ncbi:hypothetical protein [Nocardia sp. GAS34]|uniref:hypothetical protein n=1 Tax=Nocardia sp. GAS34 TaxID=3156305 RepID=UPI003D1F1272